MKRSPRRSARSLAALLPCAVPLALALSCSSSDEEEPPPPPGPVAFAIGELFPRGADQWRPGDPEPVVIGCDGNLGLTGLRYDPIVYRDAPPPPDEPNQPRYVRGDWLFRPPGACSRKQCGTLRVTVEPVTGGAIATGEASAETVVVNLAPLADALEGRLHIVAELMENGTVPAVRIGQPLADELEIEVTREDCSTGGDAGAGGAPGGAAGEAGGGGV